MSNCTDTSAEKRIFCENEELQCRELFRSLDIKKRGRLDQRRVASIVERNLKRCDLNLSKTDVDEFASMMFDEAESTKYISYRDFRNLYKLYLLQDTGGSDTHQRRSVATLLMNPGIETEVAPDVQLNRKWQAVVWFQSNEIAFWWIILYIVLNLSAFGWKYHSYCYLRPDTFALSGRGLCISRGMAQVCLLNACLVLLPLCRGLMGFFRDKATLRKYIPIDHSILFHKICGYNLVIAGLIHTGGQMYAYITKVMTARDEIWNGSALDESGAFPGPRPGILDLLKTIPGWSGVVLVAACLIATPFTLAKFRRENFNGFWYSHFLFYPVFMGFFYFHGIGSWLEPTQAYYFTTIPILIFTLDRFNKVKLYAKAASIRIRSVQIDKDAVGIVMGKPQGFHYLPGMYIILNVPELSKFEWHPFTLTSAPDDDFLSVCIRASGDWTKSLRLLMKKAKKPNSFPNVKIDGPVGAPTQDYLHYNVLMMIGSGIGVTPFACILRDTAYRMKKTCCEKCGYVRYSKIATLKKMYFHWMTRSQSSLRWFESSFKQVVALDADRRIEIHNHLTSVRASKSAKNIKLIQTLMHHFTGRDMISGLETPTRTHFGRPDWDEIFADLVWKHPGETIGVFYCGNRSLETTLQSLCRKFNTSQHATNFIFHSEKF